jgi:hypothetical protein
LYEIFVRIVSQVESVDARRFPKYKLRLKTLYPYLVFYTPKIRNGSEIVYSESLSAGDLVNDQM